MDASAPLGVRQGEVAAKVIDGEAILINLSTGLYYSMGSVGGRVWSLIEEGCSAEAIAEAIAAEYDVSPAKAMADVETLVAELIAEGLVQTTAATPAGRPGAGRRRDGSTPYVAPELKKFSDMAEIFAMDPPLPGAVKPS